MLQSGAGRQAWEQPKAASQTDISEQARTLQDAYSAAQSDASQALWDGFGESEQEEMLALMRATLNATQRSVLEQSERDDPAFRSIRNHYLIETYPDEFPEELSGIAVFASATDTLNGVNDEDRKRLLEFLDNNL